MSPAHSKGTHHSAEASPGHHEDHRTWHHLPVTAMELRAVIEKMKKKVDQRREEKQKLERLTQTSENYQKNAIVIRSKALQAFVDNTKTREESLEELSGLRISLEAACYRVAVFDLDLYSDSMQLTSEKRQESALMSFVLFNVSDEIVSSDQTSNNVN